jgi:hypothetical protein
MAIKAIEVELSADGTRGAVVLQSDAAEFPQQIEELQSAACRNEAIKAAVGAGIKGLPGISRTVDPAYPVNSKGEVIEGLADNKGVPLSPSHARMQPAAYRTKYEITARQ